jgi:hypothetical protein
MSLLLSEAKRKGLWGQGGSERKGGRGKGESPKKKVQQLVSDKSVKAQSKYSVNPFQKLSSYKLSHNPNFLLFFS